MTKQKQYVSDISVTVYGSIRKSSTSGDDINYFGLIPVDLVISNIFSRLPLKSIAQCRCVSKLWSSILRLPNYELLFPIKSHAPPRILLVIEVAGELFFSSLPQPQNLDENSCLVAPLLRRTSGADLGKLCRPIHGMVCRQHTEGNHTFAVISNPVTGESLTLEQIKSRQVKGRKARYYFGYDQIDKHFKVLRITWWWTPFSNYSSEYQVLTIGTGIEERLWRKIQSCIVHYPLDYSGICIDGVLYYSSQMDNKNHTIVCFDVWSEKFSCINFDPDLPTKMQTTFCFSLIDYKGKLGACYCDINHNLKLWILVDAEEHKWSTHIYKIPQPWPDETRYLLSAGMIAGGNIVLYPCYTLYPLFIYYYNLESNIITRVRVKCSVSKMFLGYRIHAFTNYVEHVELM